MATVKSGVLDAGGNPTGRKSAKYQFPAGTPEGDEERRKADAERKRQEREAKARSDLPPTLPPAGSGLAGDTAPENDHLGPDIPGEDGASSVPWTPEIVQGLLDELIEAAESGRVASYVGKCQEAGLMPKLIKEIEKDAHFPRTAKVMLKDALPRIAAKYLNMTGISAAYRDELACMTSLILIVKNDRKMSSRFDELIGELKKARQEKEAA